MLNQVAGWEGQVAGWEGCCCHYRLEVAVVVAGYYFLVHLR